MEKQFANFSTVFDERTFDFLSFNKFNDFVTT